MTTPSANISHKDLDLGTHQRADGEQFDIRAKLYDMPAKYDYWSASYDAEHKTWGHMRYALSIPKAIAANISLAEHLVRSTVLAQVKSSLDSATQSGRDLSPCFSFDGWVLI